MNNRTKGPMHFYLDGPVRARRRGALPPIHTRRNEALPDRRSPSVRYRRACINKNGRVKELSLFRYLIVNEKT